MRKITKKIVSVVTSCAMVVALGAAIPQFSVKNVSAANASSTLIWSDEFNGSSLDTSKWNYETGTGSGGWGNNERQYYTNRTDNVYVSGGSLHIKAKRENYGGMNYTSGRIKTAGKFSFKYGYVEARLALPASSGIWPAFWMLGENIGSVGWPACGEIDIMENKGSSSTTTSSALHYTDRNGNHAYQAGAYSFSERNGEGTIEDWHTYYLIWNEEQMDFYVDDHLKLTVPRRTWHPEGGKTYPGDDDAPFNKDFYVILNMAVGGNFDNGREPDPSFTSASMQVDYVRMYAYND